MKSLHERCQVVAITPRLADDTTAASGYIDAGDTLRVYALVIVGATDTTVDAKLQQASDSSGTGVKDVTDAAVTQISGTGDNRHVSIEIDPSKLDAANGFTWVRLLITVGNGTTGANVAGVVIAEKRHQPVTQDAAYAEQVVVAA